MVALPTYVDLFGSDTDALTTYKAIFINSTDTDEDILSQISTSFTKISFVFGEFRDYSVTEETVRNEHIKTAVCFESNSLIKNNTSIGDGLNENTSTVGSVTTEKMEDVSTTYAVISATNQVSDSLAKTLGLLSTDAAIILSRYVKKTYGWNT